MAEDVRAEGGRVPELSCVDVAVLTHGCPGRSVLGIWEKHCWKEQPDPDPRQFSVWVCWVRPVQNPTEGAEGHLLRQRLSQVLSARCGCWSSGRTSLMSQGVEHSGCSAETSSVGL